MKKVKNVILIVLSALIIILGTVGIFAKTPAKYSDSERRLLSQKPELKFENMLSGKFMTELEDYMLDQFPLRDSFRKLKSISALYVFRHKATHDLYKLDGYISKLEYPENEDKINNSLSKLNTVYDEYIKGTGCKTYLSIIPDKNYFLAPLGNYPVMNYEKVISDITGSLSFAEYIDIFPLLELSDYYYTDQHWRQEKVTDVAEALANGMGAKIKGDYKENILPVPLYGAYASQLALDSDGDKLIYLTNDIIDSCVVTGYSTGKAVEGSVYDFKKAEGKDAYELFLSGSEPILTIDNPNAESDKELVIFRDSFTSSLAPLLTSGYSRITLVDLRYMRSDLIGNYVNFDSQDVIFLYSTLVFNNSISM